MERHRFTARAFTLVELLTVVSILSLLFALLFPVFANAKNEAYKTTCQSNLRQVGIGLSLYLNSYDDVYPTAIDIENRLNPDQIPTPHAPVGQIPSLTELLLPYLENSSQVLRCPRDSEPFIATSNELIIGTYPSYFAFNGTSYTFFISVYWGKSSSQFTNPSRTEISQDALLWHSPVKDPTVFTPAVNTLYSDGHVNFGSRVQ